MTFLCWSHDRWTAEGWRSGITRLLFNNFIKIKINPGIHNIQPCIIITYCSIQWVDDVERLLYCMYCACCSYTVCTYIYVRKRNGFVVVPKFWNFLLLRIEFELFQHQVNGRVCGSVNVSPTTRKKRRMIWTAYLISVTARREMGRWKYICS